MPSCITHELIADSARDLLPAPIREAIDRAPDYYFLGAQGPDLFFFYRPASRREYNLGKTLHRGKLYEWFGALLSALSTRSGEEYDRCLAYALGFCSHLAADTAFHPFVYAFLKQSGSKKKVHQKMENDWDVYFLREKRKKEATGYAFPFSPNAIRKEGVLFPFLAEAVNALGRRPLTRGAYGRMMRMYDWYLAHFHRKHFRYLRPFGLGYLYPKKDPEGRFLSGEVFRSLSGAEDADDLFAMAAEESARLIVAFMDGLGGTPLPADLFSRHMLTGERLPEGQGAC